MTDFLANLALACQGSDLCDRVPRFRARIDATAGSRHVLTSAEMCAQHLGCSVNALTAWARDQRLEGQLTVFAINHANADQPHAASATGDFAFSVIKLVAGGETVPPQSADSLAGGLAGWQCGSSDPDTAAASAGRSWAAEVGKREAAGSQTL